MTRYLISFDDGAMTFPEEETPAVGEAAHQVVRAAQEAGVWVFGGGVESQRASIVATDGKVTVGPYPETKAVIGGWCSVTRSALVVAGRSRSRFDCYACVGRRTACRTLRRSPIA